jgi:CheY-like chemotaxis protein
MATIFLIEDNEMNRDMLSRRLIRLGHTVHCAPNAEIGLKEVPQIRPNLILMDLRLPGMSGWDAASKLKSNPATNDIPIIALTAHAMEGDRTAALKAGCDDYDVKPIDMPRLLEKIERFCPSSCQSQEQSDSRPSRL